jgi:putative flippase GtrA
MNKLVTLYNKYQEIILYLFFGGLTTIVCWGTYSLFAILFKKYDYEVDLIVVKMSLVVIVANALSWLFAFLFAFVTNKMWVFKSKSLSKDVLIPEFVKFFSSRFVTGFFEIIAVPLLVSMGVDQKIFNIDGMLAKIIVSVVVVVLNYVLSKLFVFKK